MPQSRPTGESRTSYSARSPRTVCPNPGKPVYVKTRACRKTPLWSCCVLIKELGAPFPSFLIPVINYQSVRWRLVRRADLS